MFESVFSQVVSLLISTAIFTVTQKMYSKYKGLNDYTIISGGFTLNTVIGAACIVLALTKAANETLFVLFCVAAFACFAANSVMFFLVVRFLSTLKKIVNDISGDRSGDHD